MSYRHLFWQLFKASFADVVYAGCFRVPMNQYTLQTLCKQYEQWIKDKKSKK